MWLFGLIVQIIQCKIILYNDILHDTIRYICFCKQNDSIDDKLFYESIFLYLPQACDTLCHVIVLNEIYTLWR